jgi:hypothetical protein
MQLHIFLSPYLFVSLLILFVEEVMTGFNRRLVLIAFSLLLSCPLITAGQWNKKPYTEWSEKDALKPLNESPWGQTQVYTDNSNTFGTGPGRSQASGDYNTYFLNIRIRFLSAKPIRQAFSRLIAIKQKDAMNEQLAAQLKAFATQDMPDYIIIAVDADSNEAKSQIREFRALLDSRTTVDLKNNTYLSIGGERLFIGEYQSPKKDGLGARFIFPRKVNGKPVITAENDEVQFYSEFSSKYKLSMRYKVKDLMYEGKLEY